jgi:hypothetical protein
MTKDIKMIRGTSRTFKISVTDAEGNPYTLKDGEKVIFGVKKQATDEELLICKVVTECVDGVCEVELDPEDTVDLAVGQYFYDVGLESGEDYYIIVEPSTLNIAANITKWGDGA